MKRGRVCSIFKKQLKGLSVYLCQREEEVYVVAPGWLASRQIELDCVVPTRIVFLGERRNRSV